MDVDSPFSEHTNTNFVPSPDEKLRINQLINDREAIAGCIDEEIAAAERVLKALQDRRAVHTRYIQEHKALLSPIRQLSHDILADIFLACLPPKTTPVAAPVLSPAKAPPPIHPALVISHVCQQWRQLALRTRLLWTDVNIQIPEYPVTPHRFYRGPPLASTALADQLPPEVGQLYRQAAAEWESKMGSISHLAKLWIDRAAPCPLTMSFRSPIQMVGIGNLPEDAARCLEPIIDTLCEASPRWKDVRFHLFLSKTTINYLRRLLNRNPEDVPLLESVFLSVQDGSERKTKLCEVSNAEILKSVSLHSLSLPIAVKGISTLPVDWEKLTTLSIGAFDNHSLFEQSLAFSGASYHFTKLQALTLLKMTPNLISCSFIVQSPAGLTLLPTSESDWIPGEVVSLPELRSMTIRGTSKSLAEFPSHLDIPSIRKLDIACSVFRAEDEATSGLARWIATFGAHLEDVSFNYGCLTQSALEHCIAHLPNVTDLTIVATPKAHGHGSNVLNSALFDNALLHKFTPAVGELAETNDKSKGKGVDVKHYLPQLQRFHCKLGAVGEFNEQALLDFLVARRSLPDNASRLKEAFVRFYLPKGMDVREELVKRHVDMRDFVLKVENSPNPAFSFGAPQPYPPDEGGFQWEDWYHSNAGDYVDLMEDMQDAETDWDPTTDDSDTDGMGGGQLFSAIQGQLDSLNLGITLSTFVPGPQPQAGPAQT